MGKNGTDVSREAADLILKDDNFATIIYAIKEGRAIFKNVRKFVSYQLSCNYSELMILFFGLIIGNFLGWQIPLLLALQILFLNLITDDFPSITLALTPSSKDIMSDKPRKNKELLNNHLRLWFIIAGIGMAILVLLSYYISFNVLHMGEDYSRTVAFLSLVLVEIANAYNFISLRRNVSFGTLLVNKYLLAASTISVSATIVIIYTPLNVIFGNLPIDRSGWLIGIGCAFTIVLLFNILKLINKWTNIFKLESY
jgi:P-type Ca2+ transporter type 2C